jgi:sphingomyelin phosphodiesterase acid-like 3
MLLTVLLAAQLAAESKPAAGKAPAAVPALLLSDIHFEPFFDPAKVPQLASAPASQWKEILGSAASPDQEQRFAALKQQCHSKGEDTTGALLQSSLLAMRAQAAGVAFITVSGDLMAHQFDCKFNTLFPHAAAGDLPAFAEKTLAYVQLQLRAAFPGVPLYVALGNNDSGCGDYQIDAQSAFLAAEARTVSADLPAADRDEAQRSFANAGYYGASLPAPIQGARLLALDDLFMSKNYATCAGKPDPTGAQEQLTWLRRQLTAARAKHEKVWVMGHIPPGVNLASTAAKHPDFCASRKVAPFLASDELPNLLTEFGDVIALALFGHTHMDELRLLQPQDGAGAPTASAPRAAIALKMVPSISPVHGNNPSFTLAQVDPATARLMDYKVIAASNLSGVKADWKEEYDYGKAYSASAFDAAAVEKLVQEFAADPGATQAPSQAYLKSVFTGGQMPILGLFWPPYVCSLSHFSAEGFTACACAATP